MNKEKPQESAEARLQALEQRVAELERRLNLIHAASAPLSEEPVEKTMAAATDSEMPKQQTTAEAQPEYSILKSIEEKAEEREKTVPAYKRFFLEV